MKMIAEAVIPESGLVPLDIQTIPIRVAMWPSTVEIKATNLSKPWDTSSFSRNRGTSSFRGRAANSLYALIADGKYRKTSLGREGWKKLITGSSLQNNCQKEGFNVLSVNAGSSRAQIGIVGNNGIDCTSSDSQIGFGTARYNTNSCGNVAKHETVKLQAVGARLSCWLLSIVSNTCTLKGVLVEKNAEEGASKYCKTADEKANKDYMLQVDEFTKLPVYCNMDGTGLGDCGGGGWTL
ncbi:hypothetical protein pdam_00018376, partial [Pocillopora damicornis]